MGDGSVRRGASRWGRSFLQLEARLSDAAARHRLSGEDAAAIAFVHSGAELDGEGRRRSWTALVDAAEAVPPPTSFADPSALAAQLATRRHVGALAIVDPAVDLDGDSQPVAVRLHVLEPRIGAGFVGVAHNVGSPVDRERMDVEVGDGAVRIVCWQRFGLASPVDVRGRHGPDAPAPLGWIRVTYDLSRDGRCEAHLASSFAPTVWFYRDGLRVHRADLRSRTPTELEAALEPRPERATGTTHKRIDTATGYLQPVR